MELWLRELGPCLGCRRGVGAGTPHRGAFAATWWSVQKVTLTLGRARQGVTGWVGRGRVGRGRSGPGGWGEDGRAGRGRVRRCRAGPGRAGSGWWDGAGWGGAGRGRVGGARPGGAGPGRAEGPRGQPGRGAGTGCRAWTGRGQGRGGRRRLRRWLQGSGLRPGQATDLPGVPPAPRPSEEGEVTRLREAAQCGADAAWSLRRGRVVGGVVSPGKLGCATKIAGCNLSKSPVTSRFKIEVEVT